MTEKLQDTSPAVKAAEVPHKEQVNHHEVRPDRAPEALARPHDIVGKTRRRMAAEEIVGLVTVDTKLKKIKAELKMQSSNAAQG